MVTVVCLVTSFPGFSLILFSGICLQKNTCLCSFSSKGSGFFLAFNNSMKSFLIKASYSSFQIFQLQQLLLLRKFRILIILTVLVSYPDCNLLLLHHRGLSSMPSNDGLQLSGLKKKQNKIWNVAGPFWLFYSVFAVLLILFPLVCLANRALKKTYVI